MRAERASTALVWHRRPSASAKVDRSLGYPVAAIDPNPTWPSGCARISAASAAATPQLASVEQQVVGPLDFRLQSEAFQLQGQADSHRQAGICGGGWGSGARAGPRSSHNAARDESQTLPR